MTSKKPKSTLKTKPGIFPRPYAVYSKWEPDGYQEFMDDFVTEPEALKWASDFVESEGSDELKVIVVKIVPVYTVAFPKVEPIVTPVVEG